MRMRTAGASGTALVCLLACLGGLLGGACPARAGSLDVRRWLDRPGTRLLVVEFYATWCTPCMEAVPYWRALHEKYRDKGLRLVVVSTMDRQGQCVNPGWDPDQTVCDPEGVIADAFKLDGKLPAAFLWSWQGNLLVAKGHVDDVTAAVEAYLEKNPRVLVEARNHRGKRFRRLHDMVRAELSRSGKLTVVATRAERKALAEIRLESHRKSFDDKLQCELGREVSANSLLRAAVTGKRGDRWLSLNLFSAESACLLASAAAPYNHRHPARAVAEAIDRLLAKLKTKVQMPGGGGGLKADASGRGSGDWNVGAVREVIMKLESEPPGAAVAVDGKQVCDETPCSRSIALGERKITFTSPCHRAVAKRVVIEKGTSLGVKLQPKQGAIRVKAKDAKGNDLAAEVYVDGEKLGRTPGTWKVSVCAEKVEVRHAEHGKVEQELELEERRVEPISVVLKGKPAPEGMVRIPAGEFWMGCNPEVDDDCDDDEKPGRKVWLDEYFIDRTEVTFEQYQRCVDAGTCTHHWDDGTCFVYTGGKWKKGVLPVSFRGRKQPVVCVDWNQAEAFCRWAGKRLPTEAEWEKAARGVDGRKYPWGNREASCDYAVMDDGGDGCGKDRTWPVCAKERGNSPYGLCDMAGNVWEWVSDWYGKEYYESGATRNPKGSKDGEYRVLRGGCWSNHPNTLRTSSRLRFNPTNRLYYYGFRCARGAAR